MTALRSRWEQEASRGQSAFKTSQTTSDEPDSLGRVSRQSQDLSTASAEDLHQQRQLSDDISSNASSELSCLPSMTRSNSCTSVTSAPPPPLLSSLLDDLRSRVNPNGYVEGSTYQYRVSSSNRLLPHPSKK